MARNTGVSRRAEEAAKKAEEDRLAAEAEEKRAAEEAAAKKAEEDRLAAEADEKRAAKQKEEETLKRKRSVDDAASGGEEGDPETPITSTTGTGEPPEKKKRAESAGKHIFLGGVIRFF